MVSALHAAGIEVILDVVYNHTAEGNRARPDAVASAASTTPAYYRLCRTTSRATTTTSPGCGNTLNLAPPARAADGDGLAALLGRGDARRRLPLRSRHHAWPRAARGFDAGAGFLDAVRQDPVLSGVKLIAEPWDVGRAATARRLPARLGRMERPLPRHGARASGGATRACSAELAPRLPARPTCSITDGRRPWASVNFVTAHDGFTLRTCVVLQRASTTRRTARTTATATTTTTAGTAASRARPTIPRSARCARRQKRNLLATLLLSQGMPMLARRRRDRPHPGRQQQRLLPGQRDQLGRLDADDEARSGCSRFVAAPDRAARDHTGAPPRPLPARAATSGPTLKDIAWLRPDGSRDDAARWDDATMRAARRAARAATRGYHLTAAASRHADDAFCSLLNAARTRPSVRLPDAPDSATLAGGDRHGAASAAETPSCWRGGRAYDASARCARGCSSACATHGIGR